MRKYELGVILKAGLEEEAQKAEFEKIHELIARFGGSVDKVDDWGRRRLGYEIQKQTEGFYSFITFTAPTEAPAEIESRLRITESILRFLIISQEA